MTQMDKRLTPREVAEILRVSVSALCRGLCGTADLRRVRAGGKRFYLESEVMALRQAQDAAAEPLNRDPVPDETPGARGRAAAREILGRQAMRRQARAATQR